MQKPNYQKMLESIIAAIPEGDAPKLLLHSCCAPCSSYCLEYLAQYFRITLLYYNPNISPEEEFRKRVEELRRLVRELPMKHPAEVVVPEYRPEEFYSAVKGMESLPAELSGIYPVKLLPSDFKKKGGYLRSIELSREYGLYRQNYCGCVFSKQEAQRRENEKTN